MQDFFFVLLRSGLGHRPVAAEEIPANPDWKAVLKTAKRQTVVGLVADAISRLPSDRQPPLDIQAHLGAIVARNIQAHGLLNSNLAMVLSHYRSHGINPLLLKGQGNALCYPTPQLRACGDIDLYFGPKVYEEACRLARPLITADGPVPEEESIKHFHFSHGQVKIEVHRIAAFMFDLRRHREFARWVESELDVNSNPALRHAEIGGVDVVMPSAQFNAFYLFYHAWFHFVNGGIGLRQLCDWGLHLQAYQAEIDRDALLERLKHYGLLRAWRLFASILVERMGFAPEVVPGYAPEVAANARPVLERIMQGGNFGVFDPNYVSPDKLKRQGLIRRKLGSMARFTRMQAQNFKYAPCDTASHFVVTLGMGAWRTLKQLATGHD